MKRHPDAPEDLPGRLRANMARYRAKGRSVNVVLTDPEALARLTEIGETVGGVKAAIETALKTCPLPAPAETAHPEARSGRRSTLR